MPGPDLTFFMRDLLIFSLLSVISWIIDKNDGSKPPFNAVCMDLLQRSREVLHPPPVRAAARRQKTSAEERTLPRRVSALSALLLLMLGILADDHDATLALDDLALFANGLDRRSHFHGVTPPFYYRVSSSNAR